MKKIASLFLLLVLSCAMLFSCTITPPDGPNGDDPDNPTGDTVRVMVSEDEGFSVKSQNPLNIAKGAKAEFTIEIAASYAFVSVSAGTYNAETGVLTIDSVNENTTVTFTVEKLDYDTNLEMVYVFKATKYDTTSVLASNKVKAGTLIEVTAGDLNRIFVGWSYGKSYEGGGTIVSTERQFQFRISPNLAGGDVLYLYANYVDSNVYYYNVNGGSINKNSQNLTNSEYYTVTFDGSSKVKVTLRQNYFDWAGVASTFWDDKTFTRDGYVLKEYNTKADGTGESYSIGSKFNPGTKDGGTLYCIWEKATPASDFNYGDYNLACPVGSTYAPEWKSSGVIINKYNGNDAKVTIPETINGKPVIAIAANAFVNKNITELILPSTIQQIKDGAFVGCSKLTTLYFPDGMYYVTDNIFDEATYTSFKNLYVNASIAPRLSATQYGEFAVKFCKVLASVNRDMIVVIAGSSTYQGLGTDYLEALLEDKYSVINYGTTRTRPGYLYLEAIGHYANEGDIVIFSPENSAYMLGENIIDERMTYDLEGTLNLYRYLDFSKYEGYFTAFGDMNKNQRYKKTPQRYEAICAGKYADKNGDRQEANRAYYQGKAKYTDAYYITLNNRIKSINEGTWSDVANQEKNKDYTDLTNPTWTSMDRPDLLNIINSAIAKARINGAKVYFGFCPMDANAVVEAARNLTWIKAYDKLIDDIYDFDGNVGSAASYIYNHKYFYDCAFHVNDYGRTYRTYQMYVDLAKIIGISNPKGIKDVGTNFKGCLFENGSTGVPLTGVDFLK